MDGLRGRTALVTGGANGIGKAIAMRLAQEGCAVGLLDRDEAALRSASEEIRSSGAKIAVAAADVSRESDVQAGTASLRSALGPITILVNNAGILRIGSILEMRRADWDDTFRINVDGMFNVTRAVVPEMVEQGRGAVVNLASWMGKSGVANYGAYCASKFCIVALTQTLSIELGPKGVRVNAIAPGLIVDTPMRHAAEAERAAQGLETAEERAKTTPLRRAGYPDDIARAAAFLASDEAAYITGETLSVTGGIWND